MIMQHNVMQIRYYDQGCDYSSMIHNERDGAGEMDNEKVASSRTIKAFEFKANCLKLMDEVADSGAEIVIIKNGHPVSRLVPYREKPKSLFGIDKGRLEILGDIIEPLDQSWRFTSLESATGLSRLGRARTCSGFEGAVCPRSWECRTGTGRWWQLRPL